MEILLLVAPLLVVACWAGWYCGQQTYYGGWGNRLTHRCGWFEEYRDFPISGHAHKPCPSCGAVDGNWHYRIGRPVFPWGWEWQTEQRKLQEPTI